MNGFPTLQGGRRPGSFLALLPLIQCRDQTEKVEERAKEQIVYASEYTWEREKFAGEIAKHGLASLTPPEAYGDPSFE